MNFIISFISVIFTLFLISTSYANQGPFRVIKNLNRLSLRYSDYLKQRPFHIGYRLSSLSLPFSSSLPDLKNHTFDARIAVLGISFGYKLHSHFMVESTFGINLTRDTIISSKPSLFEFSDINIRFSNDNAEDVDIDIFPKATVYNPFFLTIRFIGFYDITEKFSIESSLGLVYGYTFLSIDHLQDISNASNLSTETIISAYNRIGMSEADVNSRLKEHQSYMLMSLSSYGIGIRYCLSDMHTVFVDWTSYFDEDLFELFGVSLGVTYRL